MSKSSNSVNSGSIVVQVGQCGNQIGPQLFRLAEECVTGMVDRSGVCRAVCVDTEDKVANATTLNRCLTKARYRQGNVINGHFGRGSNWAMGYNLEERYGFRGEDSFMDQCMDKIRLEAERCDCFMATAMVHSMAGGTGSGVGSRLSRELRDMFPNRYIVSVVVAPLSVGENPMQCYNSLLCCTHLTTTSDQIILLENDSFAPKFNIDNSSASGDNSSSYSKPNTAKTTKGSRNVGFDQINQHFASSLAGILFPTDDVAESGNNCSARYRNVKPGMEIAELVRSVCPDPSLRFSRLDSVSKSATSTATPESILHSLSNIYKTSVSYNNQSNSYTHPSRCIACVAAFRGGSNSALKYDSVKERLSFLKPVAWNPFWLDVWTSADCIPLSDVNLKSQSVSLCSNSSSISRYLDKVWCTARHKFEHNAYLHWYENFECTKTDFDEAFHTLQNVVQEYNEAVA